MNKTAFIVGLSALLAGAAGGYWAALPKGSPEAHHEEAKRKPLYYRSPMNPSMTSPVPKQDEMGMDYVPVYAESAREKGPPGTVLIDPVTVQDIGVRTALVERRTLARTVRSVGRVAYDEELLSRLHPKVEGWITRLLVDQTGESVRRNQELLELYSPQLVASQQEYLLALNNRKILESSPFEDIRRGAEELVRSSRERLELLDVPAHQIRELEDSRHIQTSLHLHSPFDGIVVNIGSREGMYVTPNTELYLIANLSKVWVYVDIYEYEIPWVRLGDNAEMQLAALPGQTFKGKIKYIYPYLESKTRTLDVRLEFDNPHLALKPEMFANVTIQASRQVDAVVVPDEAVMRTGTRDLVFIVRSPGKFEPREVKLGVRSGGLVQILEGVEVGEEVVTSSEFLIDSESKLREAAAKMMPPKDEEPAANPHEHGGHP